MSRQDLSGHGDRLVSWVGARGMRWAACPAVCSALRETLFFREWSKCCTSGVSTDSQVLSVARHNGRGGAHKLLWVVVRCTSCSRADMLRRYMCMLLAWSGSLQRSRCCGLTATSPGKGATAAAHRAHLNSSLITLLLATALVTVTDTMPAPLGTRMTVPGFARVRHSASVPPLLDSRLRPEMAVQTES